MSCSIRCSRSIAARKGGKKSGGDGAVVTPVPIPNTAVKHRSGEDSRPRKGLENSAPPGFFLSSPSMGDFFVDKRGFLEWVIDGKLDLLSIAFLYPYI